MYPSLVAVSLLHKSFIQSRDRQSLQRRSLLNQTIPAVLNNSLSQNWGHWSWGFLEAKGSDGDLALPELLWLLHLHLVEPGLLEGLAQGGIHSPVVLAGNPRLLTILLRRYRGGVTWSREKFKPETI